MAKSFNITAQLNMASPTNLNAVRNAIQKQLGSIPVPIKFTLSNKLNATVATLNKNIPAFTTNLNQLTTASTASAVALDKLTLSVVGLKKATAGSTLTGAAKSISNLSKSARTSSADIENFGKQAGIALRRFSAFAVAAGGLVGSIQLVRDGIKQALDFQNEMVRLAQVTGQSLDSIQKIGNTIGRLSSSLGVSSAELSKIATTLAQAGFTARETETALTALAKTDLAPTFDDLNSTTEGSIALLRQFNLETRQLEGALGSLNAVSAAYAVESKDLIEAIKRSGGVFSAVGGNLNEFLALFSAVRDTTRLSAETISTGLNTILTRLERPQTIEFLDRLGVKLLDSKGKFIGAFQAVQQLGAVLGSLEQSDPRLIQISEYLAGYRQLKVIIPLIQQTAKEQQALRVAQQGLNSLNRDTIVSQESLLRQFTKLKEEFLALVRAVSNDTTFRTFIGLLLDGAGAAVQLANSIRPLIPLIAAVGAVKTITFGANVIRGARSGRTLLAKGGAVPGVGNTDSVPAMLTPGEFVIRKKAAEKIGPQKLHELNNIDRYNRGGYVRMATGGFVPSTRGRTTLNLGSLVGDPKAIGKLFDTIVKYEEALRPGIKPAEAVANASRTLADLQGKYGNNLKILTDAKTKEIVGVKKLVQIQNISENNIANTKNLLKGLNNPPTPPKSFTQTNFPFFSKQLNKVKGANPFGALGAFGNPSFLLAAGLTGLGSTLGRDESVIGAPTGRGDVAGSVLSGAGVGLGAGAFIPGPIGVAAKVLLPILGGVAGYFAGIMDIPLKDKMRDLNETVDKFNERLNEFKNLKFDKTTEGNQESKAFGDAFKARSNQFNLREVLTEANKTASTATSLESASIVADTVISSVLGGFSGGERFSLFGPSDRELEQRGKDKEFEIKQNALQSFPQVAEKQLRDAIQRGETVNDKTIRSIVGDGIIKNISTASGPIPIDEKTVIDELLKAVKAFDVDAELARRDKEILAAQDSLSGLVRAVTDFSAAIEEESFNIQDSANLIDAVSRGGFTVQASRGDVFRNLAGSTNGAIDQAFGQAEQLGFGSSSRSFLTDIVNVQRSVPNILRDLSKANPTGKVEDFQSLIQEKITPDVIKNDALRSIVTNNLLGAVKSVGAGDDESALQKALKNPQQFLEGIFQDTNVKDALEGFARTLDINEAISRRYGKALEEVNQLTEQFTQSLSQADNIEFERNSLIAGFAGRDFIPQDNRLQNRLGRLGFSDDPNEILNRIRGARSGALNARNDNSLDNKTRIDTISRFEQEINRGRQALELLADAGTLTASSFQKLDKITRERENKENLAKSFFGSDAQGRNDILNQANLLVQAKRAGTLDVFSIEQQQKIVEGLNGPLGNLPGINENFFRDILNNSKGLGGIFGRSILENREQEKQVQLDIISTYNRAIEAQEALGTDLQDLSLSIQQIGAEQLIGSQDSLAASMASLEEAIRSVAPFSPTPRAMGGPIYANRGFKTNFKPRGTDTVPALAGSQPFMLTPGEFIINKRSSQKYAPLLSAINKDTLYAADGLVNYKGNIDTGGGAYGNKAKKFILKQLQAFSKVYNVPLDDLGDIIVQQIGPNGDYDPFKNNTIRLNSSLFAQENYPKIKKTLFHELGHYIDDYLGKFEVNRKYRAGVKTSSSYEGFASNKGTASKLARGFAAQRDIIAKKNLGLYNFTDGLANYYNRFGGEQALLGENFADSIAYNTTIAKNSSRKQRRDTKAFRDTVNQLIAERDVKVYDRPIKPKISGGTANLYGSAKLIRQAEKDAFRANPEEAVGKLFGKYQGAKSVPFSAGPKTDTTGKINNGFIQRKLAGKSRPSFPTAPSRLGGATRSVGRGLLRSVPIAGAALETGLAFNTATQTLQGNRGEATYKKVGEDLALAGTNVAGAAGIGIASTLGLGTLPLTGAIVAGTALGYKAGQFGDYMIGRTTARFNRDRAEKANFEEKLDIESRLEAEWFKEVELRLASLSPSRRFKIGTTTNGISDRLNPDILKSVFLDKYLDNKGLRDERRREDNAFRDDYRRESDRAKYDARVAERDAKLAPTPSSRVGVLGVRDATESTMTRIAEQRKKDEEQAKKGKERRAKLLADADKLIAANKPGFYNGGEAKDALTARLTQGEYVINPRSSRKYRDLIQDINSDTVYRAKGGATRLPVRQNEEYRQLVKDQLEAKRQAIRDRAAQSRTNRNTPNIDEERKKSRDKQRRNGTRPSTGGKAGVYNPRGDSSGTRRPRGTYYKGSRKGNEFQEKDRAEVRDNYIKERNDKKEQFQNRRAQNEIDRDLEKRNNSRKRYGLGPVGVPERVERENEIRKERGLKPVGFGKPGTNVPSNTPGATPPVNSLNTQFGVKNGTVSPGGFDTKGLEGIIKQFNDTLGQFQGLSIELKVQDIKVDLTGADIVSKLEPALKSVVGDAIIAHLNTHLKVPGNKPLPPLGAS